MFEAEIDAVLDEIDGVLEDLREVILGRVDPHMKQCASEISDELHAGQLALAELAGQLRSLG